MLYITCLPEGRSSNKETFLPDFHRFLLFGHASCLPGHLTNYLNKSKFSEVFEILLSLVIHLTEPYLV